MLIVDGFRGRVILQPTAEVLARYRERMEVRATRTTKLSELRDLPAQTLDGTHVKLMANIEFPYEVEACLARGAEGVGLYRTEFLYLGSVKEPTEDQHFDAYNEVVTAMGGKPVVMRTLDLGADKMGQSPQFDRENIRSSGSAVSACLSAIRRCFELSCEPCCEPLRRAICESCFR